MTPENVALFSTNHSVSFDLIILEGRVMHLLHFQICLSKLLFDRVLQLFCITNTWQQF